MAVTQQEIVGLRCALVPFRVNPTCDFDVIPAQAGIHCLLQEKQPRYLNNGISE
jgi:short subunit dehydrogenase-like uncharacterized protein